MDILRVLQTLGICVGAVAPVAIAIMLFLVVSAFGSSTKEEDEDDEILHVLRGMSRDDIHEVLTTPVYEPRPRCKPRTKKAKSNDVNE